MKTKKKFLKLPEYPGGKEAFKKYIESNMIYPAEAIQKEIQGVVHLSAEIDDNGNTGDVFLEKGLGAGCDEEAIRLIKNVRFGGVKNRGLRLKTRKRFRIEFKLPAKQKINYRLTTRSQSQKPDKNKPKQIYSYTIQLK